MIRKTSQCCYCYTFKVIRYTQCAEYEVVNNLKKSLLGIHLPELGLSNVSNTAISDLHWGVSFAWGMLEEIFHWGND